MSAPSSSAESRRQRIRASALLAAYGDALGFVTEMTDRQGLMRRAGVDHVEQTVPWQRRIGGQFGPTVRLPEGTVSDDTQLRLATSRSIGPSGAFDVETFAAVELTVWPSYALGAGRGSLAAAAALRKRDVTWATNFFSTKGVEYVNGGGNGAAMRVQPHVWATPADAELWSWLGDVLVNAVTTHGHARGLCGAVFHAACVDFALREGEIPGPAEWRGFIEALELIGDAARHDERLAEIWRRQWEKRTGRVLADAVAEVAHELRADAELCGGLAPGRPGSYADAVEAVKAFDPAQRGSGTKTALLAAVAAWLHSDAPDQALRVTADFIGTDTDSIATMAGAVLGAAREVELPGALQDADYIAREADRMWAAGAGRRPPRFPYPDLLNWRAPRSATDAVMADDDVLYLAGLGPAGAQGDPYVTGGKSPGVWQWTRLWFGQMALVKRRERPPELVASQRVDPVAAYIQADLLADPTVHNGGDSREPGRHAQRPVKPTPATERSVDEIVDDVIRAGLDDASIGAGLRELARREAAIEQGIAYTSIVLKALISRGRRGR